MHSALFSFLQFAHVYSQIINAYFKLVAKLTVYDFLEEKDEFYLNENIITELLQSSFDGNLMDLLAKIVCKVCICNIILYLD